MSSQTNISWTKHTWNPWEGCQKISTGCENCYMFAALDRFGRDPAQVHRTGTWNEPIRWEASAAAAGVPSLVFTCSFSDWFHKDADAWRPEAWQIIRRCPHLQFQVLTKRPLRIVEHLPPDWGSGYDNVWLGVSVEDNDHVWRADVLSKIPARIRFISAEPLLGPLPDLDLRNFHWLIVGGESGPNYRHMDRAWARQLRDQAKAAGVAFFFKQSSAPLPGKGDLLDGRQWHEFPRLTAPRNRAKKKSKQADDGNRAKKKSKQSDDDGKPARAGKENRQESDGTGAVPVEMHTVAQEPVKPSSVPVRDVQRPHLVVIWKGTKAKPPMDAPDQSQEQHAKSFGRLTPILEVTTYEDGCAHNEFVAEFPSLKCDNFGDPIARTEWWYEIRETVRWMKFSRRFEAIRPFEMTEILNAVTGFVSRIVPFPTPEDWDIFWIRVEERARQRGEPLEVERKAERRRSKVKGRRAKPQKTGRTRQAKKMKRKRESKETREQRRNQEANAWRDFFLMNGPAPRPGLGPTDYFPLISESIRQDLAALGLSWPCTFDDVKTAYRVAVKKTHPDRSDGADEEFKRIQAAYERLEKILPEMEAW